MDSKIAVTTSQHFEGSRITGYLGIVRGIVVRSPDIGRSLLGGLKGVVGGNINTYYEEVCEEAREQAFRRMLKHASAHGADGVIAMHYDATEYKSGVTEVLCYGTAVKLQSLGG